MCDLDYLNCSLVGSGKGSFFRDTSFRDIFYGAGCGCINQVGDLCPIVTHLYLYLYESIKKIKHYFHSFKTNESPHNLNVALCIISREVVFANCGPSYTSWRSGLCKHVLALM